jgi:pimeloyl-ACP methyl ester carboxylesterase/PKD repeat protein
MKMLQNIYMKVATFLAVLLLLNLAGSTKFGNFLSNATLASSTAEAAEELESSWSAPRPLTSRPRGNTFGSVSTIGHDFALDSEGTIHIVHSEWVWETGTTSIIYDCVTSSGMRDTQTIVTESYSELGGIQIGDPDIFVDSYNNVHITYERWEKDASRREIWYIHQVSIPVLLVHGWHGSKENWTVIERWLKEGGYPVEVLEYDDSQHASVSADSLAGKVEEMCKRYGVDKINIIAHSFGGLVSRYYIEEREGDKKVDNLIMIATPNHGFPLADYLTGETESKQEKTFIEALLEFYGYFRADRKWGSSLDLRTRNNQFLDMLNLRFDPENIETKYFVIAGTGHYRQKYSSSKAILPGPDDGVVQVASASLRGEGVPLYCVDLDHSSIVNPRNPDDTPDVLELKREHLINMYIDYILPILRGSPKPSGYPPLEDPDDNQLLGSISSFSTRIAQGDSITNPFNVSTGTSRIEIGFRHEFSDFNFTLLSPSGRRITPAVADQDPDIEYFTSEHYWYYSITNPENGSWEWQIDALDVPPSGENIMVMYVQERSCNQPPVAEAGGPYVGDEGSAITFDGRGSTDPDGDTIQYRWDFNNDGTWDTEWSSSPTADHTWGDDLSSIVMLEVSDGELTDTDTASVAINNVVPTVEAGDNQEANEGDTISFDGSFTDSGADTHTMEWDFGDGSTTTGTLTPTHTYGDNGTYIVTLKVTDDDGGVGTDTLEVKVQNIAPSATINSINQPNPHFILPIIHTLTFKGSFTDPGWLDTHTAKWDFGDGTTVAGTLTEENIQPDATGTITANHAYSEPGTYTVTLTVTDDEGSVSVVTSTVRVMTAEEAKEFVNNYIQKLPDSVFKRPARARKASLANMFAAVDKMIAKSNYRGAIKMLQHCIRAKADGFVDGAPKNDWITDAKAQQEICKMIDDLISYLKTL